MQKKVLIVLFFFVLVSCDSNTIPPGKSDPKPASGISVGQTIGVEKQLVQRIETAVGTIRPLTETRIESQVSGQVLAVNVSPSERVAPGQVLVVLDSRQLGARLKQAGEGLSIAKNSVLQAKKAKEEAQAALDQAHAAYLRTKTLYDKDIVPSQKLEIDRAVYLQAKARLERSKQGVAAAQTGIRQAEEVVKEAEIALEYTGIRSPAAGIVVERLIDPGDLAVPGKPLLLIQTSGSLRLEAKVREGLIQKVTQGKSYEVKVQPREKPIMATIEEIVPYADPETRTFLVKAALPDTPGVFPGIFGRLLIPVGQEETLVIPIAAVSRVGQLEMVNIQTPSRGFQPVYIKTGIQLGEKIEVLSGLNGTETIGY